MLCHIVSDTQIMLIASIYHENPFGGIKFPSEISFYLVETAKTLLAENYRSYNTRHNQTGSEPLQLGAYCKYGEIDYLLLTDFCMKLLKKYTIIEKLKLVQNYDYQACESENYDSSAAKKTIDNCISKLISQLDGYDAAPWGIK